MAGSYSTPKKNCDMVMKGGITSGVVYPLAVCELAETYTFKSIGGTSAGAIAAAAAAAAEYGRQNVQSKSKEKGFEELEKLPDFLGKNLFTLFQPQRSTKKLFNVLAAGLSGDKGAALVLRLLGASIVNFPLGILLGILPGLILAILAILSAQGTLLIWSLISAVLLILLGFVLGFLLTAGSQAMKNIPNNFYGLCSGMPSQSGIALTSWMAEYLDQLAGIEGRDKPLTFGDLWGDEEERNITLEMLTTNLTMGESERLPFDTYEFFFDPQEFEQLFPKKIVDWMKANPAKIPEDKDPSKGTQYLPIPEAKDLPVVVATRFSVSFPILLSAIPLYAVDYSRLETGQKAALERCWFSDGGIVSNIPVHFFDKPLSRWPTFAIDLQSTYPGQQLSEVDQSKNIWTPTTNTGGIGPVWTRIAGSNGRGSILGFLGMIFNVMQNWLDNAQMRVPGYRDRVVHILLNPEKEGGLNLKMSSDNIKILSERGRFAGRELRERFAASGPVNPPSGTNPRGWIYHPWDNHRWVRFRSVMSLLEGFLKDFARAYKKPVGKDKPYKVLIQNPVSYDWARNKQRKYAKDFVDDLISLVDKYNKQDQTFTEDAPRPTPVLQVKPKT